MAVPALPTHARCDFVELAGMDRTDSVQSSTILPGMDTAHYSISLRKVKKSRREDLQLVSEGVPNESRRCLELEL